jgi:type VI secretion system secreted protein VgrG
VTVRFLWDRDAAEQPDMTSYWVPVATSWAGSGFGVHFLPREGMEVVVGYVGGDPDQPIVLGCREAGRNALPVKLPSQAGKSGIFTRSLRRGDEGHDHWSELSFDDEAGREKVTLRAGWDYERRVLNDDHSTIDHDEVRKVGNKQTVHVVGASDHTVDKDAALKVHGARVTTIDGNDSKTVTKGDEIVTIAEGARTAEVRQKDTLTVHGDREQVVKGSDELHVHHKRTVRVDEALTVRQGETVVEWADGHVDVSAKSWVRIKHAGARVHIDDAGNVTIETDKDLRLLASGAAATLGNGKAEITAETEATIAVGGNSVKVDASGVTTSANNVTTSATCMHQMTAPIIAQN